MKLDTGNTFNNLLFYIFITNEYGKPTENTIDLFINTFGKVILNGNFKFNNRERLDKLWNEVKDDLADRGLSHLALYRGGFDWFKQLSDNAYKLKTIEQLRKYIINSK